jgi:hypothetical protein
LLKAFSQKLNHVASCVSWRQISSAVSTVLRWPEVGGEQDCRCGALWIRRLLSPVRFWQDNCFKGIHCTAAISCRLGRRVVIAVRNMQLVLPKIYHASCYPRSGFSTNRQLMNRRKSQLAPMKAKPISLFMWFRKLELARGSEAKIRGIMSVLFNHAIRHEVLLQAGNPIAMVRQSAKRRPAGHPRGERTG